VRNFRAAADVLVIPSLRTRSFREPWGLVANEAMNQSTPIIASDEVGAVAGGLVRHERNGLVVTAGDSAALAAALRRLHDDEQLRARLGANARRDVFPYTFDAWAAGFAAASWSFAGAVDGPVPPLVPPPAGGVVPVVASPLFFFEPPFAVPFLAAASWARAMTSRQLPYWSASAGSFASASRYSFCV
jgi:hypothetical protein